MDVAGNSRIAGRYVLEQRIGTGGAGAVWRGRDAVLGRAVAVKQVRVTGGDPARSRERVMREARAAARLHHPRVTAVYDVVEDADTVHIVMELVDGPSLDDRVRQDGPLPPAEAAVIGLAVLDALQAAHGRGIVHRDVKPGNVLLAPDGPKLTDFGVAAVAGDASLTAAGMVLGSPSYMAPEQARGEDVGPAADLWGLGALLHYAVEGAPPFDRGDPLPTLAAVVGEPPVPAERAGALGGVIEGLLRKDPSERLDPPALRRALREVADDAVPTGAPPAGSSSTTVALAPAGAPTGTAATGEQPAAGGPATTGAVAEPSGTGDGRRTGRLVIAALAVLVVLGGIWWTLGTGEGEQTAAPPVVEPDEPSVAEDEGTDDDAQDDAAVDEPADDEPADGPDEGDAEEPADDGAPDVPEGFTRSSIGPVGASAAHPADWQRVEVSPTVVDHRAPDSGTYLRTDWTDEPADDPVADWEQQSAAFGSSREGYEELRIEPTTVSGHDAAIWEYRYVEGGANLRAINVAIVTGDHAYALNVQSTEAAWSDLQPTIEAIIASFEA